MHELRHLCLPEPPPKKQLSFRMRLDELRGDLGRSLEERRERKDEFGGDWRSHGNIPYVLYKISMASMRFLSCRVTFYIPFTIMNN